MPKKLQQIIIPTGYESQQRAIERRRKIADALLAQGMGEPGHMQSWLQVLGKVGQTGAGLYLGNKANKVEDQLDSTIQSDYADRLAKFREYTSDPSHTPQDVVNQFGSDPLLTDEVDPYRKGVERRITERENIVKTPTTFGRAGDLEGKPIFDPNAMVVPTGRPGEYGVNATRVTAALASQPNVSISGAAPTIQDPNTMPPSMGPAPSPVPPASSPDAGVTDLMKQMSPEDIQIVTGLLEKYAGKGASLQGIVPNNIPYGNPTDPTMGGTRPPDGMTTDGQPYWIVNGIPYDNPEGR